jgi:N-carbamoyl-L-amino-acid hydrolase
VPASARVWLDARGPDPARVEAWRAGLEQAAAQIGAAARVPIDLTVESHNPGSTFDPVLRERLIALSAALGQPAPEIDCYAGHDAGLLAARVPAAMVLVRNESGVSHSPEERVELEDAAFGAGLLLRLVEEPAA